MSAVAHSLQEGLRRHRAGDLNQAERLYREVVRIDPAHADAFHLLGGLLASTGRYDQATECYQKLISLRPDHVESRCLLGKSLEQQGELDAALDVFQQAAERYPDSAQVQFGMGHVYLSRSDFQNAERCYQRGLSLEPGSVPNWKNLGCIQLALGRVEEAKRCLKRAVQLAPDYAPGHFYLGNVLIEADRIREAVECYRQALKLHPQYAEAWARLGRVLLNRAEFEEARNCLERALSLNPQDFDSCIHLGLALKKLGKFDAAEASYRRAVSVAPEQMLPHYSLGRFLHSRGQFEEAVQSFQRAIAYEPGNARLHFYLGNVYKVWGRIPEAIAAYRKALEIDPDIAAVHYELGNAYRHLKQYEQACECYQQVLAINPDDSAALISLGNVLKSMDRLRESAECYGRVIKRIPDRPYWKLWVATLCPMVFPNNEQIDAYRGQLGETLEQMAGTGSLLQPEEVARYGCPPPYNLQFHGRDNRLLKEAYAHLFRDFVPRERPPAGTGKPKIGFLVTSGHEGAFLRYLLGVVERLNPERFEIVICCSAAGRERMRPEIKCDTVQLLVLPQGFPETVKALREARFDVLYYWEIGSDVTNYFLPLFRPAPVQCTSLGVLETSGVPQVDYYISSSFIEPAGADAHYTENLIRARTLLSRQPRLELPAAPRSRAEFGIPPDRHVYLCPHKIQKFHPEFDPFLEAILQNDPQGLLVIPEDVSGYAARNLRSRMQTTMPGVFDRILFVPFQTLPDYLSLTAAADVLLDPINYGGGLTAYDGISLNQPAVTMPIRFARGRFTGGLYQQIGVTECTVSTPDEYVQTALKLGKDREYRAAVIERIREHSELLFDDLAVVAEYERIFEKLVEEARSR